MKKLKNTPTDAAQKIMEKLHADLKYWQRELRIDHIDVRLRWMEDEEDGDACGITHSLPYSHEALIAIRHPKDIPTSRKIFTNDLEVILVHELIHVGDKSWDGNDEAAGLFASEAVKMHHEIRVDAIAEALVRARRSITR